MPAARVKGKKGARKRGTTLCRSPGYAMAAILEAVPSEGQYLFAGGKEGAGSSNAAMSEFEQFQGHGLVR